MTLNNNYFISTNGGVNFTYTPKNDRGRFINATDYDNTANILYCGHAPGQYFRWENPGGGGPTTEVSVSNFGGDSITHVAISPFLTNRVLFGLSNGAIVRVDDAHTGNIKTGVTIRSDLGANHTVSCIAIDPTNENHMLVTYSNYGVTHVYESSLGTGGSLNWNPVDGNLPDMPVRWCMFDPRNSNWAILATELGIWSTNNLSGNTTNWSATNNNFANTRVDMLRYRPTDRLLLAATHGRGLFSTNIPVSAATPVTLLNFNGRLLGNDILLNWETATEQNSKGFEIQRSDDGIQFARIGEVVAAGNSNIKRSYSFHDGGISQENNYYRLKQIDLDGKFEYSRIVLIRNPVIGKEVFKLLTNPFANSIDLQLGNLKAGRAIINLYDLNGKLILRQEYNVYPSSRLRIQVPVGVLPNALYNLEMIIDGRRFSAKLLRKS